MNGVTLSPETQLSARKLPALERFIDRTRGSWNLPQVSTFFGEPQRVNVRSPDAIEHMQLTPTSRAEVSVLVEAAGPLRFHASAGQVDFDPDEESPRDGTTGARAMLSTKAISCRTVR